LGSLETFAAGGTKDCYADEADLGFSNFADAAFLCAFGKSFATLQVMSWKRSLMDSFWICSQTALSRHYHRPFEMQHRVDVRGLLYFHLHWQRKRASTEKPPQRIIL
jgi:hypothetical protein